MKNRIDNRKVKRKPERQAERLAFKMRKAYRDSIEKRSK